MSRRDVTASQRRWRLRNNALWLLSAVLGAAAVFHAAAMIHGSGQRRAVGGLLAAAVAEHLVTRASGRLEVLALEAFAPAGAGAASPEGAVAALARGQREGVRCACRELLPAAAFFRVELATGALAAAAVDSAAADAAIPPALRATLVAVARDEAGRGTGRRESPVHLVAEPRLGGRAVVTVVQQDARGAVAAVYGLVAEKGAIMRTLFTSVVHPPPLRAAPGGAAPGSAAPPRHVVPLGLARLDTLSIQVAGTDAAPVFGTLDPARHARATVRARGALEGLTVTVAVAPGQTTLPLAAVVPRDQLWFLGALLLCTVLATLIAIGSTRREALLARARSDFIASVSHDLRMPLAQILLASETLTLPREPERRERQALASSVLREARRLVSLVENVLLFSRAGAVELRARLEPVAVPELLEDVIEAVQLAAADAGQTIELHAEGTDGAPLAVLGDRRLLRQALVNLVDNALKYGAPGQRVRLGASPSPGAPDRVRLTVDDEGPGIPAALRARVFEPYERLGRDQDSERTGTGLGLAVVRHVAQACDGRAWLEEAPPSGTSRGTSRGTRAVLELRAAAPVVPPAPTATAPEPAGAR